MSQPGFKKNLPYLIVFTILAGLMLAESIKYHNKFYKDNWRREIYADGSGYFIYHHMWFVQGYESKNYEDSLDALMGYGFSIKEPIIKNKYTCGVAYLQAPFVGGNTIAAKITGKGGRPESRDTNRMVAIAAMIYAWLAAILLFYFLINYVKKWIAFISIILIYGATNVFSYAVYQPGMAHIYSFFLFSLYLFIGDRYLLKKKRIQFILVSLTAFLIVLIRPTDIFFLPILFFIRNGLKENLKLIFTPANIGIALVAMVLVWAPQSYYWHLSSGKFIYYSYGNEGFTNAMHPKIAQVFFAPDNGLIPYSLIFVILIIANIYLVIKKYPYAVYFLIYQLIALYLIASWHVPNFGGAYGQRNYVQIFAGYALILALVLEKTLRSKIVFASLLLVCIFTLIFNQKIVHKYQQFYFGNGTWDWREYWYYVNNYSHTSHVTFTKYTQPERTIIEKNNNRVLNMTPEHEFYYLDKFSFDKLPAFIKDIHYSMRVKPEFIPYNLEICMTWHRNDSVIFSRNCSIDSKKCIPGKWNTIHGTTNIGKTDGLVADTVFIYLWNIERKNIQVDDVNIRIE